MSDNLQAEWGSAFPVKFAQGIPCDSEGKPLPIYKCANCDNDASTCVIGRLTHIWLCNDCANPNQQIEVEMIYRPKINDEV